MESARGSDSGPVSWLALVLVLAHLALALSGGRATGATIDEPGYFNSGRILLRHGCVTDQSRIQGPLALMANQLFVDEFPPGGLRERGPREALLRGRLGTLPFALLTMLVVFVWARMLFGVRGGILALAFAALDPLLLGYDGLLLVDAHHTAFVALVLFLTWRYLETRSFGVLVWLGVALGCALGTKYLALFLVAPVLGLVAFVSLRVDEPHASPPRARWIRWSAPFLVATLAVLTLHALYRFQEPFASTRGADHASDAVRAFLAAPFGALLGILPAAFVKGVDFNAHHAQGDWQPFLAGKFAAGHVSYYAWALWTKLPELVWLGLVLVVARLPRLLRSPLRSSVLATLAVTSLYGALSLGYLSFFNRMQFGVRYVVPLVPLLCVWLGSLGWRTDGEDRLGTGFLALCVLIVGTHAVDLARSWPDWIHYANTLSGGKERAYLRFRDTNADFGQYRWSGPELLEARLGPLGFLNERSGARTGRLAIDLDALAVKDSLDPGRPRFDWLTLVEPSANLGSSWYVFECTSEGLEASLAQRDDPLVRRALVLCLLGEGEIERAQGHLARLEASTVRAETRLVKCLAQVSREPGLATLEALVKAWLDVGRPDQVVELVRTHPGLAASRAAVRGLAAAQEERRDLDRSLQLLESGELDTQDLIRLVDLSRHFGDYERMFRHGAELERRYAGEPGKEKALAKARAMLDRYRKVAALIE